eukprot:g8642.t2
MGSRHARLARRRERGSRYGMIHGRGGERGGQQYRKETDLRRTGGSHEGKHFTVSKEGERQDRSRQDKAHDSGAQSF